MDKKYILHHKQFEALQLTKREPISAYVGGIGSGKSTDGAHFAIEMVYSRPHEMGAIFSPTYPQLSQMTMVEFKAVLDSKGIYEDEHYVVNKHPKKKFGYESKFTQNHNNVYSFCNGAQIYTFSLESFYRGASFGWAWGDEIQEATNEDITTVLGRMRGSMDPKTFYTLTPPRGNPDIDDLIYGENHIPVVFGTTYDNAENLPPGYIKGLEDRFDKYTFAREVMCERVNMAGFNWLYSFDRKIHAGELAAKLAVYRENEMVYISFDFNVNPFVCTLSHRGWSEERQKRYIHYFDTVIITPDMIPGQEYIDAIIKEIKERTKTQAAVNAYMITGDASGRANNIVGKVGQSAWSKILDGFRISKQQIILPRVNPTHIDSRVLCNSIFAKYDEVLVNPKCKKLISDCEFVKAKPDGSILKENRNDPNQQADLLDAMRYDLQAFSSDFVNVR